MEYGSRRGPEWKAPLLSYFDQVEVASPGRGDLVPDGRPISLYGGPSGVVLNVQAQCLPRVDIETIC